MQIKSQREFKLFGLRML